MMNFYEHSLRWRTIKFQTYLHLNMLLASDLHALPTFENAFKFFIFCSNGSSKTPSTVFQFETYIEWMLTSMTKCEGGRTFGKVSFSNLRRGQNVCSKENFARWPQRNDKHFPCSRKITRVVKENSDFLCNTMTLYLIVMQFLLLWSKLLVWKGMNEINGSGMHFMRYNSSKHRS